ncbi:MAG: hypothetical protein F6K26_41310 [Moorea sp. SIO2I5]|nr:hypothetical protein [Moorena sp. SIO2I5]
MALEFREFTISFDPTKGQKQRERTRIALNGDLVQRNKVQAVLKGFHMGYTDDDREIKELEIDLDIEEINTSNNSVTVAADFLIRDASGKIDDRFDGFVQGVVIAEVR